MGMEYGNFFGSMDAMRMINGAIGAVAGVFLAMVLFAALIGLAIGVTVYVMTSLSCYKIAKRRGIHHPWLAWIPVGNSWILGSISDQYQYVAKGKVRNRRKALLGLAIATVAISIPVSVAETVVGVQVAMGHTAEGIGLGAIVVFCTVVTVILGVVGAVIQYIAYYDLFRSCEPGNSVLYLILGIVFSITLPIFLFICRDKDEGMPPRRRSAEPTFRQIVEEPEEETAASDDDAVTEADFEN